MMTIEEKIRLVLNLAEGGTKQGELPIAAIVFHGDEIVSKAFDVDAILTKAILKAAERIDSLIKMGYRPINKKVKVYDDYFVNKKVITQNLE